MKVRVVNRPSGLLNGHPWPEVGETFDLPDAVAEDMVKAGVVAKVEKAKPAKKAETRPASTADVETRGKK